MDAVVAVVSGVGYLLGLADDKLGLTKQLVDALDVQFARIESGARSWKAFFEDLPNQAEETALEVLDFAMETAKRAGLRWVDQHLNKIMPTIPRLM